MPTARRVLHLSLALLLATGLLAAPAAASPTSDARDAAKEERWPAAADAWMQVLEKSPANREAALGLAEAVVAGGLLELQVPAEDALQAVLEKKKDDRDARLALGDLFIARARSKTDPQAMKFIFEDAKLQFQTLLDARPTDEEAAVGLARTHYWTAFFSDALQVLDDFLAQNKSNGPALFWKGQIYYLQALDAYRAAGQIDDATKQLFQDARGAYEAAAKVRSDDLETWMQLGYACQYVGALEDAQAAYEKAMAIDRESHMPLKGIAALYHYRQDEYLPALQALAAKFPENRAVHFFLGFLQYSKQDYDAAIESLGTYVERARDPGAAWHYLGRALDGAGRGDEAVAAYRKALEANPADDASAAQLDQRLVEEHASGVGSSLSNAKAAIAAYKQLFALVPRQPVAAQQRGVHAARGVRAPPERLVLDAGPRRVHPPLRGGLGPHREADRRPGGDPRRSEALGVRRRDQRHRPDVPVLPGPRGPREGGVVLHPRPRADRRRLRGRVRQPDQDLPEAGPTAGGLRAGARLRGHAP